jgi:hypothetical protein
MIFPLITSIVFMGLHAFYAILFTTQLTLNLFLFLNYFFLKDLLASRSDAAYVLRIRLNIF